MQSRQDSKGRQGRLHATTCFSPEAVASQQAARDLLLEKGLAPHANHCLQACSRAPGAAGSSLLSHYSLSLQTQHQLNIRCCRWQRAPETSCQLALESSAALPHNTRQ